MTCAVRCGTPNSMAAYPIRRFAEPKHKRPTTAAKSYARNYLLKATKYCQKYDQAALARLRQTVDEVMAITFTDWAQSSATAPLLFVVDIGSGKLAVELWSE